MLRRNRKKVRCDAMSDDASKKVKVDHGVEEVSEILAELSSREFWGEVTIRFQNGKPVVVTKSEQIKIEK